MIDQIPSVRRTMHKVRLQFCIQEYQCPGEEITRLMGYPPDTVREQGKPVYSEQATRDGGYPINEWSIRFEKCGLDVDALNAVRELSASLARTIEGFEENLKALPPHRKVVRVIVTIEDEEVPAVIIDSSALCVFARIGARLEVEQTDYRE